MISQNKQWVVVALMSLAPIALPAAEADSFSSALTSGKVHADFRLRFESVDQNNALQDADALTLRSRLGYTTGDYQGFSALVEFEDSRSVFGVDDYSVPPTGFNSGVYSVIADPDSTEVDQGLIQYKASGFTAKLGRQVITLDNHRFVGHVGWRQDRQTFDGLTLVYKASDALNLNAVYLTQRNRIFAEEQDVDSQDTLLNAAYKTSYGTITAYAYLLEVDDGTDNSLDTYGLRFAGSSKAGNNKVFYVAEIASQDANDSLDTDYFSVVGGIEVSAVTVKAGLESLGSDAGKGAFSTPLATLHKFNGWADQFLGTPSSGLEDLYLTLSGKVAKGAWLVAWHDYSSDVSNLGGDDLGDEINLQYQRKFYKHYYGGIKYADYSAGDPVFGKVDTDKLWLWLGAKF